MIEKPTLNVVFIGNVQSGTSTLAGRLLFTLGTINNSIMERIQNEATRPGMFFANILCPTRKHEITRGTTIHIAHSRTETKHYYLNIIDAPVGSFQKNMIRAVSQANVGIVVVNADIGLFEDRIPEIKEILITSKSMGIIQLVFCVNKLDNSLTSDAEHRFLEVQNEITKLTRRTGYLAEPLVIPISAWIGSNVLEPSEIFSWFKGPPLLDAINDLKPPTYHFEKPLRIPILEIYNLKGVGTVVFGKIESGILKLNTKIRFTNGKKIADGTVGSIEIFRKPVSEANAGQMVSIKLENVNYQDLKAGMILSDAENNPAREISSFEAEIAVIRCPNRINPLYKPTFHCYTLQTRCQFNKLLESSNMPDRSGKQEFPAYLTQRQYALVLLKPDQPFYLEPFESFPPFGRFVIRDNGHVVSVGIVKKLYFADEN